ncbi:hypothetical protein ACMYR2_2794 [Nitrobacter sp. TKz-YC01]
MSASPALRKVEKLGVANVNAPKDHRLFVKEAPKPLTEPIQRTCLRTPIHLSGQRMLCVGYRTLGLQSG